MLVCRFFGVFWVLSVWFMRDQKTFWWTLTCSSFLSASVSVYFALCASSRKGRWKMRRRGTSTPWGSFLEKASEMTWSHLKTWGSLCTSVSPGVAEKPTWVSPRGPFVPLPVTPSVTWKHSAEDLMILFKLGGETIDLSVERKPSSEIRLRNLVCSQRCWLLSQTIMSRNEESDVYLS